MEDELFQKNVLENLYEGIYFVNRERKITRWNKAAESITGYKASEVVDKNCNDTNIAHIDEDGIDMCFAGFCPLEKAMSENRICQEDGYLRHKDGHRLFVKMRVIPEQDSSGKVIGAIQIFHDNSQDKKTLRRLEDLQKLTLVDTVTELGNRRYGEKILNEKFSEMKRYNRPFGLLYIDIDGFKKVNNIYGHEVGDKVLKMVSKSMLSSIRPFDIVYRWDGEEFVGIILNVNYNQLRSVAERMRILIEKSGFNINDKVISITVSIGATLARTTDTPETFLKRADKEMYRCKTSGGNYICIN